MVVVGHRKMQPRGLKSQLESLNLESLNIYLPSGTPQHVFHLFMINIIISEKMFFYLRSKTPHISENQRFYKYLKFVSAAQTFNRQNSAKRAE